MYNEAGELVGNSGTLFVPARDETQELLDQAAILDRLLRQRLHELETEMRELLTSGDSLSSPDRLGEIVLEKAKIEATLQQLRSEHGQQA